MREGHPKSFQGIPHQKRYKTINNNLNILNSIFIIHQQGSPPSTSTASKSPLHLSQEILNKTLIIHPGSNCLQFQSQRPIKNRLLLVETAEILCLLGKESLFTPRLARKTTSTMMRILVNSKVGLSVIMVQGPYQIQTGLESQAGKEIIETILIIKTSRCQRKMSRLFLQQGRDVRAIFLTIFEASMLNDFLHLSMLIIL